MKLYFLIICFFTPILKANAEPIHDAASSGDLQAVKLLLTEDFSLLEKKDPNGFTPLLSACVAKKTEIAEYLIKQGANVNVKTPYGFTPLLFACNGLTLDNNLIKLLLLNGADVNAHLDRGLSAMHWIGITDNLEAARLLIDHGANLDVKDNDCYGTVLHMSINLGISEKMTELIINKGAKRNQLFSYGNTELHLAALRGYTSVTKLLIEKGADVQALNIYNRTPLYYAARHGYRDVADILIAAGAKYDEIVEANYNTPLELTQKLEEKEAYLWYLNGLYGQGYAVKTRNHLLVFDAMSFDYSPKGKLANGKLKPEELSDQNIIWMVSKALGLSYNAKPLEVSVPVQDIHFVFDSKPANFKDFDTISGLCYIAVPNDSLNIHGVQIHTIPVSGHGYGGATGVGYLVEADGLKIFHSGFHAVDNNDSQIKEYKKQIDFLKRFGPVDFAFITVAGHLSAAYEPYYYMIDQLSPKAIYLMGGDQVTEEYQKCIEALKARNVPVLYPDGGIAAGQRFHYMLQ